jgi:hypothetical protein
MNPSLIKAKIFATLALIILTLSFTFPMLAFHGTLNNIEAGKINKISSLSKSTWNLYNKGRYKSVTTPKEAYNNLSKMIDAEAEIGPASLPLWSVSLEAPNYPKAAFPDGIPVLFHFDGYSGEVHEMDTINHYVGMDPMWVGGHIERALGIYALLLLSFMIILFIAYNKKILSYIMLIPAGLPFIFIADYSYWLYWFGHNLHNWGAFTIKPFMPTVFGDGHIAQFTTHSYPTIGFYMLLAASLLSILAFFAKQKALNEMQD